MAIKKEDLLKFVKSTVLSIKVIEDDSGEDTEVKVLHLTAPVNAIGSNVTSGGLEMKVQGSKVYVAAEDIEKMLDHTEEKDGILIYKGPMHLDVSKPNGRMQNGEFVITKPSKIWLTATKFSKRGGSLRRGQTESLNGMVNKMFSGAKPLDLSAETVEAATAPTITPEVVPNQKKETVKQ